VGVDRHLDLISLEVLDGVGCSGVVLEVSVLNIGYQRHIGRQNYISNTRYQVSRYGTKYQTLNQTSYQMKNIHVIAYINHMKLLKQV